MAQIVHLGRGVGQIGRVRVPWGALLSLYTAALRLEHMVLGNLLAFEKMDA